MVPLGRMEVFETFRGGWRSETGRLLNRDTVRDCTGRKKKSFGVGKVVSTQGVKRETQRDIFFPTARALAQ